LADAPVILVEALTPSFAEKDLVVDIGVDDCLFLVVGDGASEEFFPLLDEGGDCFGGGFDDIRRRRRGRKEVVGGEDDAAEEEERDERISYETTHRAEML
jgi:hypothetical protein